MHSDDILVVNKENMEKVLLKLRGIKLLVDDISIKNTINEIIEIINNEVKNEMNSQDMSIEEMIIEKMNETKYSDPELNFNLYMLYRKLQEKKIGINEAVKIFESYIHG